MTLLRDIREFCVAQRISESRFGRLAADDPGFVNSLRKGRAVGPRLERRVRSFLKTGAGRRYDEPATPAVASPTPAKPEKFRVSAGVIRAAKVDGRDLPTFVTALIDMGLECWRDDRAAHGEVEA